MAIFNSRFHFTTKNFFVTWLQIYYDNRGREKKKQENPNCEKLQQVDMSLETTG